MNATILTGQYAPQTHNATTCEGLRHMLDGQVTALASQVDGNDSALASLNLRVDDLESEVVLKAEVTSGGITKLAAVELDASIDDGANLELIADDVTIRTSGSEAVFDGDGLTFDAPGFVPDPPGKINWGSSIQIYGYAPFGVGRLVLTANGPSQQMVLHSTGVDITGGLDVSGTIQQAGDDVATEPWVSSNFASDSHNHDGDYVESVSGGTGIAITGALTPTVHLDGESLSPATSVEYVIGVTAGGNTRKITPANLRSAMGL